MREIGGYLELDKYRNCMLHEHAIALNSGRNCLAMLIQKKNIRKIYIPKFLCAAVANVCERENVVIEYYSIGLDFLPVNLEINSDGWLYIVNYYGQLTNEYIQSLKDRYINLIIDNAQAYFQTPMNGVDTIYTCRKYFGVSDGAFLYSNISGEEELEYDISYNRLYILLGRYEKTASEFYSDYVELEKKFQKEPIKRMSKLTRNLLSGIDYDFVENVRSVNFKFLHKKLRDINLLNISVPEGPYTYPLFIKNGDKIRKKLQSEYIYISTLWSDVFYNCEKSETEYIMAKNILPLPIDQRYTIEDMEYLVLKIKKISQTL